MCAELQIGILWILFTLPTLCATNLYINPNGIYTNDITFSNPIPLVNEKVKIKVRVHNEGEETVENTRVRCKIENPDKQAIFKAENIIKKIPDKSSRQTAFIWAGKENGLYKIEIIVDPENEIPEKNEKDNRVTLILPVVLKKLYFFWWVGRRDIRWINIISENWHKEEVSRYWLSRGVIPACWRGGYCKKNLTKNNIIRYWIEPYYEGYPAIAIDEFNYDNGGKIDKKMAEALLEVKKAVPKLFVICWGAGGLGADLLLRTFKTSADLVVPEIYVRFSEEYKRFDITAKLARKFHLADKTIIALGLGKWITTEYELENQIRYVRKIFPESPGIGFFCSGAYPELIRCADKLCFKYFIKPVITHTYNKHTFTIKNIGAVDARNVKIEYQTQAGKIATKIIPKLSAYSAQQVCIENPNTIYIKPSPQYTLIGHSFPKTSQPAKLNELIKTFSLTKIEPEIINNHYTLTLKTPKRVLKGNFSIIWTFTFKKIHPYCGISFDGNGNGKYKLDMTFYKGDLEKNLTGMRGYFRLYLPYKIETITPFGFQANNIYKCVFIYDAQGKYTQWFVFRKIADNFKYVWDSGKIRVHHHINLNNLSILAKDSKYSLITTDREKITVKSSINANQYSLMKILKIEAGNYNRR